MGKKHKKQMRQKRVSEARKPKPPPENKRRKFVPLRFQPPIVFVRGEDYEPVKYSMKDSRDIEPKEQVQDVNTSPNDTINSNYPDSEPAQSLVAVPDLSEAQVADISVANSADEDSGVSAAEPAEEPDSPKEHFTIVESLELPHDSQQFPTEAEADHSSLESMLEDFDKDASEIDSDTLEIDDEIDEDLLNFDGDPGVFSASEESEQDGSDDIFSQESDMDAEMNADFDYNDMELDELVRLGNNIDEDDYFDFDYDYDMGADSDADDIIDGLINGASLDRYAGPAKMARKPQKKELSRRRRERLDAREASRAINFGKDPPVWTKYPEKMSVHDVVTELQTLVATPKLAEIRFPPLDHNANWYVSELAKLHSLKVKSYTAAKSNCVLVLKTSRSGPADYNRLKRLMMRRQTFARIDKKLPSDAKASSSSKGPKASRPKEGDIVGHNADAVSEGFGHRMMTQMGWSHGTGLGPERDGIQLPLLARVKLTKKGISI